MDTSNININNNEAGPAMSPPPVMSQIQSEPTTQQSGPTIQPTPVMPPPMQRIPTMPTGQVPPIMPPPMMPPRFVKPPRIEQFSLFGMATLLYSIFYTFCLFKNDNGIMYPIWAIGTLIYCIFCTMRYAKDKDIKSFFKGDNLFYLISIFLLGLGIFLTTDYSNILISKLGIILLLISFYLHNAYDDSNWNFLQYFDAIGKFLISVLENLNTPLIDLSILSKNQKKGFDEHGNPITKKTNPLLFVFLGIVISLPLLLVVVSLLSSADIVFKQSVDSIIDLLNINNIIEVTIMTVFVFFVAYSSFAAISKRSYIVKAKKEPGFEPIIGITVGVIIGIVYLFFSIIQITYLFMGEFELPNGYTYAQYAKTGFYELLTVCIINLLLVLLFVAIFRKNIALNLILTVICICTYIMVASSGLRMYIYICAYNLTSDRLFTYVALFTISVLMAGLLIFIYKKDFKLFRFCMITITLVTILYVYSRPDYWIAKYNISHYGEKEDRFEKDLKVYINLDTDYLLNKLSDDAAPVIMNKNNFEIIYNNCSSQNMIRKYYNVHRQQAIDGMSFRTINLSEYLSNLSFKNIEEDYHSILYSKDYY